MYWYYCIQYPEITRATVRVVIDGKDVGILEMSATQLRRMQHMNATVKNSPIHAILEDK